MSVPLMLKLLGSEAWRGRVEWHEKTVRKTCLPAQQVWVKQKFKKVSLEHHQIWIKTEAIPLIFFVCGKSCLSINCLLSFALRVSPGWQTRCFSWHSIPVLLIRLRELKRSIWPPWIIHLHGACFPSNAVTCNSASSGPYSSTPAPPSSSNCTAVEQCQCGHGKNQWRSETSTLWTCFFNFGKLFSSFQSIC